MLLEQELPFWTTEFPQASPKVPLNSPTAARQDWRWKLCTHSNITSTSSSTSLEVQSTVQPLLCVLLKINPNEEKVCPWILTTSSSSSPSLHCTLESCNFSTRVDFYLKPVSSFWLNYTHPAAALGWENGSCDEWQCQGGDLCWFNFYKLLEHLFSWQLHWSKAYLFCWVRLTTPFKNSNIATVRFSQHGVNFL